MNTSRFSLSRREALCVLLLMLLHVFAFPQLVGLLYPYASQYLSDPMQNFAYYALSTVLTLVLMRGFLRRQFDNLCDNYLLGIYAFFSGAAVYIFSTMAVVFFTSAFKITVNNPNDALITGLAAADRAPTAAMSIFLAPIVEETIFRGGVFGMLGKKSRAAAYAVSILLFSLYHVWQFVFLYRDPSYLLYALQYLPASFVLCWCYERSGSLWVSVLFHMCINYIGLSAI